MFKERLQMLMNENNLTKTQLHKATGIPDTTINGWFRGQTPGADKVIKLAKYFEVSTDYLLGLENDIGVIEINKDLTAFEKEILSIAKNLRNDEQKELIGFAKALAKKL